MSDEIKAAEERIKAAEEKMKAVQDEMTATGSGSASAAGQNTPDNPGCPEGDNGAAMLMRMNVHHKPLRYWGYGFIDWKVGMEILDVGCGGGAAVYEMLIRSEGSVVKGIDHSEKSISISKALNAESIKYERCRIEKAEVQSMPFIDEEFDLVTAIETVYFWKDPLACIREIRRVLKTGGKFVVMDEACNHDTWAEDREKFAEPFVVYTADEIAEFMRKAGFAEVRCERGEGENICVIGTK